MIRVIAMKGIAAILCIGSVGLLLSAKPANKTEHVMVHCPAGNQSAFVTPVQAHLTLGDSLEWRMTGQVVSDSLVISLKDEQKAWPFDGDPSRGGTSARANDAHTAGTYGYNVTLLCRVPGGGTNRVVIDPDIIIE